MPQDIPSRLRLDLTRLVAGRDTAIRPLRDLYGDCRAIAELPWVALGVQPGASRATQVRQALDEATAAIPDRWRRRRARWLCGLSAEAPTEDRGTAGASVSWTSEDVLCETADQVARLDAEYRKARQTELSPALERHVGDLSWETYDDLVHRLADRARAALGLPEIDLDPPAPDAVDAPWPFVVGAGIIALTPNGMLPAAHLSHLLRCRLLGLVGDVSSYDVHDVEEQVLRVRDLLLDDRDGRGQARRLLLVDDAAGPAWPAGQVGDFLRRRYDDVHVVTAVLLRDTRHHPSGPLDVHAAEIAHPHVPWRFPWECARWGDRDRAEASSYQLLN